jgi:subtilisin family serine protease
MLEKRPDQGPDNIASGEWEGQPAQFYNDRIIVKLKPRAEGVASFDELYSDVSAAIPGGELLQSPSATGRIVASVDPSTDIPALAAELSSRDDVEWAEPDVVDSAALIPSDPRFAQQWGLTTINAPDAWDLETGATSVVIGVIDSGISMAATGGLNHPDLDAARYVLGTDFVDGGTPRDLNGHGTHVAGIASGEGNNAEGISGVNWGSQVYICRTLDASGNGSSANFAAAVEEIVDWAVAHSVKAVINYSGGGAANNTKRDACQYVHDHDMILCAATGNDNAGPVIFPAAYSTQFAGVIGVGSTDQNDTVSSFSNVGPEVTVVAPGRGILSTMPTYAVTIPAALNYDTLDGTSMATPCVTGLVALMWSRHPGFTNQRIRDCLTGTAVKLGAGNFDNAWGFGRVDAPAALRCGDIVFPDFTRFTRFTRFTLFTPITQFTPRTRFTVFTPRTVFTVFTPRTVFTDFTPFTREPGPGPDPAPRPFVRFGGTLFAPEDLRLTRFEEFADVVDELAAVGLYGIDDLAVLHPAELADALDAQPEQAAPLVETAQAHLRRLAGTA